MFIISRQFKLSPKTNKHIAKDLRDTMINHILGDMVKFNLLEQVDRYKMKVINPEKSKDIDSALLLKIMEARGE